MSSNEKICARQRHCSGAALQSFLHPAYWHPSERTFTESLLAGGMPDTARVGSRKRNHGYRLGKKTRDRSRVFKPNSQQLCPSSAYSDHNQSGGRKAKVPRAHEKRAKGARGGTRAGAASCALIAGWADQDRAESPSEGDAHD